MLEIMLAAATLWVCPGDVYVNEPREGCKPFHQSGREGFSKVPEAQVFEGGASAPATSGNGTPMQRSAPRVITEETQTRQYASPETCALYKEYLDLSSRSDDGLGARNLTTDEFIRWEQIRYRFNPINPPDCP